MNMHYRICWFILALLTAGCSRPADQPNPITKPAMGGEVSIAENLAKLSPADRALAEDQKYCAVLNKNLLGSMAAPYKVELNGQAVFLCCDGCESRAKAHVDRTLVKAQQLRAANAKMRNSK